MKAIEVLEEEWLRRMEIVKSGGTPNKTFQRSNLYYNFLFACRKYNVKPTTFSYFKYNLIYALEDKYGMQKEELNIFSKSDAVLYRRFGTEFIVYEHTLYKCIGVLATEKSGIAEPLQGVLAKHGIFVVDTQGIQSRYAMQIMERYSKLGDNPIFTMSDYDVSGCFMMKRYQDIGAHRVTLLDIIQHLGLNEEDFIQEDESPRNNHWDAIHEEDKDWLRPGWREGNKETKRIEIDILMSNVTVETFSEAVLDLIDQYIPIKNISEVMIHPNFPSEIRDALEKLETQLGELEKYEPQKAVIREEFKEVVRPIKEIDLEVYEDDAQDILDEVDCEEELDKMQELIDYLRDNL